MKKLRLSKGAQIAIVYRPHTAAATSAAKKLALWLKKAQYQPLTAPHQDPIPGAPLLGSFQDLKSVALLINLGGDGTYLRANYLLDGRPVPIIGVNLGSLGFLTPFRLDTFFKELPQILRGQTGVLVPRTQMLIEVQSKKSPKKQWRSLNDVVIERGPSSHLIDLSLKMEREHVSSIKADGLVLATPTGSTAYNLAAGGPIVHPDSPCFIATTVAPHSLTSRPLIFPDTKKLQIDLQGQCRVAYLVVDGQKAFELTQNDFLTVRKDAQPHWMVQPSGHDFYKLLREKLSFGERA